MSTLLPKEQLARCSVHQVTKLHFCPCDVPNAAKIIYILLDGAEYPIYPEYLFSAPDSSGLCVLEVQPSMYSLPWILGDTFMRTIVPVFDADKLLIGLAQRRDLTPPGPATVTKLEADRNTKRTGPLIQNSIFAGLTCLFQNLPFLCVMSALAGGLGALVVLWIADRIQEYRERRMIRQVMAASAADSNLAAPLAPKVS